MTFGKLISHGFTSKNFGGDVFHKVTDTFNKGKNFVRDNAEGIMKKVGGKILGLSINQIEKSLKKLGVYGSLDKLWKKYGIPAIKWSNSQVRALKQKYKKIPYSKEILILAQADPRANKILGRLDMLDKVMQSLEKGDFRKTALLIKDLGITHQLSRLLPRKDGLQLSRAALHVKDGIISEGKAKVKPKPKIQKPEEKAKEKEAVKDNEKIKELAMKLKEDMWEKHRINITIKEAIDQTEKRLN